MQLHDAKTFEPTHAHRLTKSQKRSALNLLSVVKEKRDGKIKGRNCADGRKQRLCKTKEESASPTVHADAVMLSTLVDAC